MKDMRIRVATMLMAGVVGLFGAVHAAAAVPASARYACDSRQEFVIIRSAGNATVRFADRSYELRRRPSSIGDKYLSESAALIVDGPSAVFVAEDRLGLGTCLEATPAVR